MMLRTKRVAPTRSIKDMAISVTTRMLRRRCAGRPEVAERPPCFKESTRFRRVAVSAGATPKNKLVARDTKRVNASTRQSISMEVSCERLSGCVLVTKASPIWARANPTAPPISESNSVSASSWRTRLPLPAPRAARTASSRCRAELRAKRRFARLTQAMSRIRLTAPINRNSMGRSSPTRVSETLATRTPMP